MGKDRTDHDASDSGVDRTVDALGLICPVPVLRAREVLESMSAGELLEILTDDPLAELDLQVFCDRTGHELVASRGADGVLRTRIRRRAEITPSS